VVADVFAKGLVRVPKRLGFPLELKMKPVVLLSNSARISRPTGWAASRVEGLESVIKSDQLYATINRSIAGRDIGDVVASIVGPETVQRLAKELAALHVPARFDCAAKSTNATRAIPLGPPSSRSRRGGETSGSNRDTVKDRLRILRGDCLRGRSQLLPGERGEVPRPHLLCELPEGGQDSRAPSDNAPATRAVTTCLPLRERVGRHRSRDDCGLLIQRETFAASTCASVAPVALLSAACV
jgi:hypothetical protein